MVTPMVISWAEAAPPKSSAPNPRAVISLVLIMLSLLFDIRRPFFGRNCSVCCRLSRRRSLSSSSFEVRFALLKERIDAFTGRRGAGAGSEGAVSNLEGGAKIGRSRRLADRLIEYAD